MNLCISAFTYHLLVFSEGPIDQIKPMVCFYLARKLRMIFTLLKGCKRKKERGRNKEEYVRQTVCDLKNLKYLLSGLYRKSFKMLI